MMKQTKPTLDAPFYLDGIGVLRCHFCLSVQAVGHLGKCPVKRERDRQLLENARHDAPRATIDDAVNRQHPLKGRTMNLFDTGKVGCYLDAVGLRLEKTKDAEHKVIDLTLRVQPFTAELAAALHPDVRALLFTLTDATPKPLLKSCELKLTIPKQHLDVYLLPSDRSNDRAQITLLDAEISDPRVRTEKGVDGLALVFYATIGPVGREELEYVVNWYTQQRFVTTRESQAVMDFAGKSEDQVEAAPPRKAPKGEAAGAGA